MKNVVLLLLFGLMCGCCVRPYPRLYILADKEPESEQVAAATPIETLRTQDPLSSPTIP
jgi:hypothetical protein